MDTQIIHIEDFAKVCGHSNENAFDSGWWGCDHPEQEEMHRVQVNNDGSVNRYSIDLYDALLVYVTIQKRPTSIRKRKKLAKRVKALMNDPKFLWEKFRVKDQGHCFCWSCPLGYQADAQDFHEHGENPATFQVEEYLVIPNRLNPSP